jgi:hypothetical protein
MLKEAFKKACTANANVGLPIQSLVLLQEKGQGYKPHNVLNIRRNHQHELDQDTPKQQSQHQWRVPSIVWPVGQVKGNGRDENKNDAGVGALRIVLVIDLLF